MRFKEQRDRIPGITTLNKKAENRRRKERIQRRKSQSINRKPS